MLFFLLSLSGLGFAHGPTNALVNAAQVAASLYQGPAPVAIEAALLPDAKVLVKVAYTQGTQLKASRYLCPVSLDGRVSACNEQNFQAANPQAKALLESAASLQEALEKEAGAGEDVSLDYFKVYRRPTGRIWARVVFTENQKQQQAVFSCHQHGSHYDCHYQTGNSAGPDEPTLP